MFRCIPPDKIPSAQLPYLSTTNTLCATDKSNQCIDRSLSRVCWLRFNHASPQVAIVVGSGRLSAQKRQLYPLIVFPLIEPGRILRLIDLLENFIEPAGVVSQRAQCCVSTNNLGVVDCVANHAQAANA